MPTLRAIHRCLAGTTEYRMSRVKARLKFMIDDYGVEEFRKLVEKRLGFALERLADMPLPDTESDHMGIHEQKQTGRFYVGFPVYLGLMSGRQMREVADADGGIRRRYPPHAAAEFHRHRLFPKSGLTRLSRGSGRLAFPLEANGLYASSIGCIGDPHCNYAVTPTKTKLATIIERLVNDFGDKVAGLKLNLDGCPHACAQHWTGDIGLQGTTGRGPEGEPLESFDIILRGGLGRTPRLASRCCGACRRRKSKIRSRAFRRLP